MRSNPRRQRLTAWLIIACILGMLSSGLAHAFADAPTAPPWQEICSLNGSSQAGGVTQRDDGVAVHASHCAFCSKYDHTPALLPRIGAIAVPPLRESPPMALRLPWPPDAASSWTHRPRGPPHHVALA